MRSGVRQVCNLLTITALIVLSILAAFYKLMLISEAFDSFRYFMLQPDITNLSSQSKYM
eukprot:m.140345 g.140345  ORF g.140345 m.140345 type:complete len:59 (+) comp14823_c0_seq2:15-191(+)